MAYSSAPNNRMAYVLFFSLFIFLFLFTAAMAAPFAPTTDETNTWPVNEYGQTYGILDTSLRPELQGIDRDVFIEQYCPDLIKALAGDTGEIGYVYKYDLFGPTLRSPEEVSEYMETRAYIRTIPVYALDGKTAIGSMKLGSEQMK